MPLLLALTALSSCFLALSVSKQALIKFEKRNKNEKNKKASFKRKS